MRKLPRGERLRGRGCVAGLFNDGIRAAAGKVAIRAKRNGLEENRLAAISGKALGNAVKRNRLRRRIRAAYRMLKAELPKGWDLAIIARPGLLEAKWQDVMRDVRTAVERAAREESGGRHQPPPNR